MPKLKKTKGYKPGKEQVSVNGGEWRDTNVSTKATPGLLGSGMAKKAAKQMLPQGYEEEDNIQDTGPGPVTGQPVYRKKRKTL